MIALISIVLNVGAKCWSCVVGWAGTIGNLPALTPVGAQGKRKF